MNDIYQAHSRLGTYMEDRGFRGYDPYDALNSRFSFLTNHKWPSVFLIQILKRLTINLRPLLGIKRGVNPKALGLMLSAYGLDYHRTKDESLLVKMEALFDQILELRSEGFREYCWGYDFKWASPVKTLDKYSPTIVVSGFIARGLMSYYEITGDQKVLEVLKSIGRFASDSLPHYRDEKGLCVSYSTVKKDICFNASLLAGELFAALFKYTSEVPYREMAVDIARFAASHQKEDGTWAYSIDVDSGKERIQTDFHQGYVVDSLRKISQDLGTVEFEHVISRGLAFYLEEQFSPEGRSYWRLPSKWPTDIHHQAQGVITAASTDIKKARSILSYTLKHFQNADSSFGYRKHRLISNRISYMRWGNAWMYLAISTFRYHEQNA